MVETDMRKQHRATDSREGSRKEGGGPHQEEIGEEITHTNQTNLHK